MSASEHIAVCVTNDLCTDQRVSRICTSLAAMDYEVTAIGRKLPNSMPVNWNNVFVKRMHLLFRNGPLFYAWFNIRLFLHLLLNKYTIIWSNDMDTLWAASLAARWKNLPLVFDSHELFSEVPELQHRPAVKRFWKRLENRLIPKTDYRITVSNSIARYYKDLYGLEFKVIRNVPVHSVASESYGRKKPYLIYQGSVNLGRGIDLMIDSLQFHELDLVICGKGDVFNEMKDKVQQMGLAERVLFTGRLQPEELRKWTRGAAIGLSLEADLGLNYRFALPNKLFDYVHAGIPVIVSNLPEMKSLTHHYRIGEVLEERTGEALAECINDVMKQRDVFRNQALKAADDLTWEHEEEMLIQIMDEVISR